jgi:hypothetical protein
VIAEGATDEKTAYIRVFQDKGGNLKNEPWDSSTEKAKILRLDDFGAFNEVQEMAKPKRTATNRQAAVIILKEIAEEGVLTKNNDGLKERHYLYSPLEYAGSIMLVKITVKEYINNRLENNLYSIEVINIRA